MLLGVAGLKNTARSLERQLCKHLREARGLRLIYVLRSALWASGRGWAGADTTAQALTQGVRGLSHAWAPPLANLETLVGGRSSPQSRTCYCKTLRGSQLSPEPRWRNRLSLGASL